MPPESFWVTAEWAVRSIVVIAFAWLILDALDIIIDLRLIHMYRSRSRDVEDE